MKHQEYTKRKEFVLAFVILLAGVPCATAAQYAKMSRTTLKGIKTLSVQVTPLGKPAEKAGLSVSAIRTDTELRLREAGITVVDGSKSRSQSLFVNVTCVPDSLLGTFFACNVRVALYQPVALLRDMKVDAIAPTWIDDEVLIMGRDRISDARSTASDLVEEFVNDFLAANPRR